MKMMNDEVPTMNVLQYSKISMRTIQRYLGISKGPRTVERLSRSGRPKITTPIEDGIVVRLARQIPGTTAAEVSE